MKKNIDSKAKELFILAINNEDLEKIIKLCNEFDFENYIFHYSSENFSFIKYALKVHKWKSVEQLVKSGGSLKPSNNIWPLLELTLWSDYTLSQVEFLVKNGADVNEANLGKFTPFFNVSYDNNLEVGIYLKKQGANLHIKNNMGVNAIGNCIASPSFNPLFLIWLLENDISPDNIDKDGESIVDYCKKNPVTKVIFPLCENYINKKISKEQFISSLKKQDVYNITLKDKLTSMFIPTEYFLLKNKIDNRDRIYDNEQKSINSIKEHIVNKEYEEALYETIVQINSNHLIKEFLLLAKQILNNNNVIIYDYLFEKLMPQTIDKKISLNITSESLSINFDNLTTKQVINDFDAFWKEFLEDKYYKIKYRESSCNSLVVASLDEMEEQQLAINPLITQKRDGNYIKANKGYIKLIRKYGLNTTILDSWYKVLVCALAFDEAEKIYNLSKFIGIFFAQTQNDGVFVYTNPDNPTTSHLFDVNKSPKFRELLGDSESLIKYLKIISGNEDYNFPNDLPKENKNNDKNINDKNDEIAEDKNKKLNSPSEILKLFTGELYRFTDNWTEEDMNRCKSKAIEYIEGSSNENNEEDETLFSIYLKTRKMREEENISLKEEFFTNLFSAIDIIDKFNLDEEVINISKSVFLGKVKNKENFKTRLAFSASIMEKYFRSNQLIDGKKYDPFKKYTLDSHSIEVDLSDFVKTTNYYEQYFRTFSFFVNSSNDSKSVDKVNHENIKSEKQQENIVSETEKSSGCYIATCVYGNYNYPEVNVLRRYRDNKLAINKLGALFIKIYYKISPLIVRKFGKIEFFRTIIKKPLDLFVRHLMKKGYCDSPYIDN